MPVSTAPGLTDRIAEEFEEMQRLRAHYGPGLCSKGTDEVFETNGFSSLWSWPSSTSSQIVGMLGGVGTRFRFGNTKPSVYGRVTYEKNPVTPGGRRKPNRTWAQPMAVARRGEGEIEIGIGLSLREIQKFRFVSPEMYGRRPYYTYDKRGSDHIGVLALTVTTTDGGAALVQRRNIAGEGYDLFDEEAGGRVLDGAYLDNGERAQAIVEAFHSAYWNSVSEPI